MINDHIADNRNEIERVDWNVLMVGVGILIGWIIQRGYELAQLDGGLFSAVWVVLMAFNAFALAVFILLRIALSVALWAQDRRDAKKGGEVLA